MDKNEKELIDLMEEEKKEHDAPWIVCALWFIVAIVTALLLTPMQFWFIIPLFLAISARMKTIEYWIRVK